MDPAFSSGSPSRGSRCCWRCCPAWSTPLNPLSNRCGEIHQHHHPLVGLVFASSTMPSFALPAPSQGSVPGQSVSNGSSVVVAWCAVDVIVVTVLVLVVGFFLACTHTTKPASMCAYTHTYILTQHSKDRCSGCGSSSITSVDFYWTDVGD